ncbi:hypothetical protein F4859DRAFT_357396 [Xylaria cf. heliscus]|nr:hypothetical protein F4859DRAFT_357396 [Xylaria cf. heliscus]
MARPLFCNIFLRLPPTTAALLLCAVFDLTAGHALPRQTKTVPYHELDVIPFPPLPTGKPLSPFDLKRRQENTICGFIGGDLGLPATCSPGSHCVLDAANWVVGCCPNGGACTTGVFTGCVDWNSSPQTEINPYIYTCQGADVCFMNNFAGGYFQYGCGTASSLGTTVQTSADGATTALSIETVYMSLTEPPSSLMVPTTIGSSSASTETASPSQTDSQTDPTTTSISSASTSSITSITSISSTSSTSSTTSPSTSSHSTSKTRSSLSTSSTNIASPTGAPPTPTGPGSAESAKKNQNGAIIGGVVGGAAAAISLIALVFFCLRRRNRNQRIGPGPAPAAPPTTQYISPMRSHGAAFAPLPSWQDEEGSHSPNFHNHSHPHPPEPYGPLESTYAASPPTFRGHPGLHPTDPYGSFEPSLSAPAPANLGATAHGYSQPLRYNPGYMPPPNGVLTPVVEEDQSMEREDPPGREIDDFSRAYSSARIGQLLDEAAEEDRTPLRNNSQYSQDNESIARRSEGHRPLWQQNRQQGRNLMWL